jgi:hypothetical protein
MSVGHPLRSHASLVRGSAVGPLAAEQRERLSAYGPGWRDLVVALLSPDPADRKIPPASDLSKY